MTRRCVLLLATAIGGCLSPSLAPPLDVGDAKSLLIAVTKRPSYEVIAVHAYSLPLQEGITLTHKQEDLEIFALTFPCELKQLGIGSDLEMVESGAGLPTPTSVATYAVTDQRWVPTRLPDSLKNLRYRTPDEGRCHQLTETASELIEATSVTSLFIDPNGNVWFKILEADAAYLHRITRDGEIRKELDSPDSFQSLFIDEGDTIWGYGPAGRLSRRDRDAGAMVMVGGPSIHDQSVARARVIAVPSKDPFELITLGGRGELQTWDSLRQFRPVLPKIALPEEGVFIISGELIPISDQQVLVAAWEASLVLGNARTGVTPNLPQGCSISTGALDEKNERVIIGSSCGHLFESDLTRIHAGSWEVINHSLPQGRVRAIAAIGTSLLVSIGTLGGGGGLIEELLPSREPCEPIPLTPFGIDQLVIRNTEEGEVLAALATGNGVIQVFVLAVTQRARSCE